MLYHKVCLYVMVITAKNIEDDEFMKDVALQIFFISNDNSLTQCGLFPPRGKSKEAVAYELFR